MKKRTVCSILFCFALNHATAEVIISKNTAHGLAACSAGAAGFLAYKLPWTKNVQSRAAKSLIVLGSALFFGLISEYFFQKFTIEGRLDSIDTILEDLSAHPLFSRMFYSTEDLLQFLNTQYSSIDEVKDETKKISNKTKSLFAFIKRINKKASQTPFYEQYKTHKEELDVIMKHLESVTSKILQIQKEGVVKEKIGKIKALLIQIENSELLSHDFSSNENVVRSINTKFNSGWPLIDAKVAMNNSYNSLKYINQEIQDMFQYIDLNTNSPTIEILSSMQKRTVDTDRKIKTTISCIINHSDYQNQLFNYEKHLQQEAQKAEDQKKSKEDLEIQMMRERRKQQEELHNYQLRQRELEIKRQVAQNDGNQVRVNM
jgi:hypothetical protein